MTFRLSKWNLIAGLALFTAFSYCYYQTLSLDHIQQYKIVDALKELSQEKKHLESDCIRSKAGLLLSYDSIVAQEQAITIVVDQLRRLFADSDLPNKSTLVAVLNLIDKRFQSQFRLIEQFKSANSILRGSYHYLPITYNAAKRRSPAEAGAMLTEIFELLLARHELPENDFAVSITRDVKSLENGAAPLGSSETVTFLSHVKHILEYEGRVDDAIRSITADHDDRELSSLQNLFNSGYSSVAVRSARFQAAMYLLFVLVLAYLAYVVGSLRRAFAAIKAANSQLESNVSEIRILQALTEDKVARRTEERNRLGNALKALERVLGVIGHELRTPLASMRVMIEYILQPKNRSGPEFEEFINLMHNEIKNMSDDVNDLLEVARLNSGAAKWNWAEFSVVEVCKEALDTIRLHIDKDRLTLLLDVSPASLTMNGDAAAVRRLLTNLISNSFRYTTEGTISIIARRSGANDEWIEIKVCDTGSGMDRRIGEQLGIAFALNRGVVTETHITGSGLGLAICRGIVAAHGGNILVESAPGRGTDVTVMLKPGLSGPEPTEKSVEVRFIERTDVVRTLNQGIESADELSLG